MNPTEEKRRLVEEATRINPQRSAVLEDYANDLRAILKKLRRHLN
jgi:hypothetical protein